MLGLNRLPAPLVIPKRGGAIGTNKKRIINRKSILDPNLMGIYPEPNKVSLQYFFFWINAFDLSTISNGSSVPQLNKKDLIFIPIPLPPLETQKRIVELLDRAQALIDKRKEQIKLTDDLIQSLFYDMFGDPFTNLMGWKKGIIRDLAVKTQYGTSKKAHETDGEFPVLRMNNITYSGALEFSKLKYIDLDSKEQKKYLVHRNEILFNRTNSEELVGKTAVYKGDLPVAYAGYLVRLITNNKGNPDYISAYLNSKHGKAVLFNKAKSIVGMANINAEEFKDIRINIPPIALQNTFAQRVEKIEAQKQAMTNSLKELEDNFNGLMQRAFKGELDRS